jgi:hypothetical protein
MKAAVGAAFFFSTQITLIARIAGDYWIRVHSRGLLLRQRYNSALANLRKSAKSA